jgi:predicted transcriptional regulator
MKIKKVQIGIKSVESVFEDAKETMKKIERGESVREQTGVYFSSFEAFRKALTPKRLALLHIIKTAKPKSLHELAEITKRDIKNISQDVKYLEQVGFIEKQGGRREIKPTINYDRIALEIAI